MRGRGTAGLWRYIALIVLTACLAVSVVGCAEDDSANDVSDVVTPAGTDAPADEPAAGSGDEEPPATEAEFAWTTIALTDVVTGEQFTIAELAGRPVLVESFAVW